MAYMKCAALLIIGVSIVYRHLITLQKVVVQGNDMSCCGV